MIDVREVVLDVFYCLCLVRKIWRVGVSWWTRGVPLEDRETRRPASNKYMRRSRRI